MCSNAAGRKRGAKMKIRKVLISLVTCFIVSCFIHVTIVQADDLVTDGKAAILIVKAETGKMEKFCTKKIHMNNLLQLV